MADRACRDRCRHRRAIMKRYFIVESGRYYPDPELMTLREARAELRRVAHKQAGRNRYLHAISPDTIWVTLGPSRHSQLWCALTIVKEY